MHWIDAMHGGWMMIIWWVLGAVVIYAVVRGLMNGKTHSREDSPLEILKKRYASGEISKKEFEEMKNALR